MPALHTVAQFLNIQVLDSEDLIAQWHEHGLLNGGGGPLAGIDPMRYIDPNIVK